MEPSSVLNRIPAQEHSRINTRPRNLLGVLISLQTILIMYHRLKVKISRFTVKDFGIGQSYMTTGIRLRMVGEGIVQIVGKVNKHSLVQCKTINRISERGQTDDKLWRCETWS